MAEPPVPESPSPKPAVVAQDLQRLGPFRIERRIGAGGMGAVYLVRKEGSKQPLALKVLPREKAKNPTLVKRFQAEAQSAAQIRHPNVVEVVDSGEADGYLYIAMEYVDGTDLHDFVRKRGPIPVRRTIEIVKQVASALQHAYEQNIVHRDIKPSNLLLRRDGQVKLSDFGLARSVDEASESDITRAGTTVGTVDFMSPEQARNSKSADVRSDLYSLGCAWYHMLTGHAPFPDGGLTNKLQAHAIQAPPDPRTENPAVTDGLVAILHRLMAKKPADRYQTPKELLDDLEAPGLTRQGVERNILSAVLEDLPSDQQIILDDDDEDIGDLDFDTREEMAPDQKPKSTKAQRILRSRRDGPEEPEVEEDEADAPEAISRRVRKKPSRNKPPRRESVEIIDGDVAEEVENVEAPEDAPVKRRRKRPAAEDESAENEDTDGRKSEKAASRKGGTATTEDESKDKPKKKDKRRKLSDVPDAPRSSLNWEPIRNVSLLILGLVVVVGLGSLAAGFASRYFGGGQRTLQQLGESNEPTGPSTIHGATVTGDGVGESTDEATGETVAEAAMSTTNSAAATREERPPVRDPLADPDWLTQSSASNVKVIRVGRHQPATSLAEGIDQAKGASVLELVGSGVFFLPTLELENRRLQMRPADGNDHPVVVWKPSARGVTALTLRGGLIEMTGLHLVIDLSAEAADGETNGPPTRLAAVEDGQFLMRECSLTCVGNSPVTGIAVVPPTRNVLVSAFQQQVGLDRCILRGDRLTPVMLGTSTADVTFHQCLSVLNEGPLAAVEPHGTTGSETASKKSPPGSLLRVLNTTAWGNRSLLRIQATEEPLPAAVTVGLRDSLIATASPDQGRLIDGAWPSQGGSVEQGRLRDFRLHIRDSAILGLTNLVNLAGQSTPVTDSASLARFFGANARSIEQLTEPWRTVQADSWTKLTVAAFDPATLPPLVTRTRAGRLPGSVIADLDWPNELSPRRLAALARRPDPPAANVPPQPGTPLAVDLNKQDLGLMIERDKLPDNTMIVATGSGRCQISPFRVAGRSLRIRFEQGNGPPLSLVPKTIGRARPQWIMLAEQGGLHLEGAALQIDQAAARAGFQTMFSVVDSQLRLDRCRLLDANTNPAEDAVLVDWVGTTNGAAFTVIQSSLQGAGIALRAAGSRGRIALDNVLLVGGRAAMQVAPQAADGGCSIDVDWNHVTAASDGPAVDFRLPAEDVAWNRKLRMFVENSAFLASSVAGEKSDQSRVAGAEPPGYTAKCVEWWGRSNGFSSNLAGWFRGETTGSPPGEQWAALWGKDAEVRLLSTPDGIAVAGATIRGEADDPARFELLPGCRGASWGDGGTPLGILPGQLAANPTPRPARTSVPAPAGKPGTPAKKSKAPAF